MDKRGGIVLELGSVYVKCGIIGESSPRCVLRWNVHQYFDQMPLVEVDEWVKILIPKFQHIFFRALEVSPRGKKIILLEDLLETRNFRNAIAKILFNYYEVANISLMHGLVSTVYSTGLSTLLVIDSGWRETRVLPIYKSLVIRSAYRTANLGSKKVCEYIEKQLLLYYDTIGEEFPINFERGYAEKMEILDNVLIQACFANSIMFPVESVPDIEIPVEENVIFKLTGNLRKSALESIFSEEIETIAELVLDTLLNTPIDIRLPLMNNIVIIGGCSMITGFENRLFEQLQILVKNNPKYYSMRNAIDSNQLQFPDIFFPRNLMSWIGGSICGALDDSRDTSIITKEQFIKDKQILPDWLSLRQLEFYNSQNH